MFFRRASKRPARPALTVPCAALLSAFAGSAQADIFHVPADYPTIQDAISPATDGDEIVIAPGTYAPFMVGSEEILFRSTGGPEVTIIDGGGTDVCVSSLNGKGTFEGLTFTNGSGTNGGAVGITFGGATMSFDNCIFSNNADGAVGSSGTYSPFTFMGCTFIDNNGSQGGATRTGSGEYVFVDCSFLNNTATERGGAISINNDADISITGCTFEGNSAPTGGAIRSHSDFSDPGDQLDDCVFDGNTATGPDGGGAIWTDLDAPITNCTFLNNTAQTGPGGGVHATGAVTITGGTFDQNDATNGGGIRLNGGSATDCTFTGNSASGAGGAVYAASEESTLSNCTMSENNAGTTGGAVYVADLAILHISDSTLCLNTPDQFDFVGAFLATNVFGCDVMCPSTDAMGACCVPGGLCVATTESNCIAAGGTYQGDGATCGRANCAPPPTCLGDIVDSGTFQPPPDGVVDGADLAVLLGAWGACE